MRRIKALIITIFVAMLLLFTQQNDAFALKQFASEAEYVWGQPDMYRNVRYERLSGVPGHPFVVNDKLLLAGRFDNRVLIWNTYPQSGADEADILIGKSNFYDSGSGCAQNRLYRPSQIWSDGNRIVIADRDNNRILIYNSWPTSNLPNADIVLGQPDFSTCSVNTGGLSNQSLSQPYGVTSDGTRLFVADYANNRILIWDEFPTTNQEPADQVIGQPDFISNTANNGGISASSLYSPEGITYYDNSLYVTDYTNNRVFRFDVSADPIDKTADQVIGQPDFLTVSSGTTSTKMYQPDGISIGGGKMCISEWNNNRVLLYNTVPAASNPAADKVFGQLSFTLRTSFTPQTMGNNTLSFPSGCFTDGNRVIIADYGPQRTLFLNSWPTGTNGTDIGADFVIGKSSFIHWFTEFMYADDDIVGGVTSIYSYQDKLFVGDSYLRRLTIFDGTVNGNEKSADIVAGQADFNTALTWYPSREYLATTPQSQYSLRPTDITVIEDHLIVSEYDRPPSPTNGEGGHRISIFNQIPNSNTPAIDYVIGQPDFITHTSNTGGISSSSINFPQGLNSYQDKLFVADSNNHRILIYNDFINKLSSNPISADAVLGQPDMISNTANNGGLSGYSLNRPYDIFFDGSNLLITDTSNNRVLLYNSFPASWDVDADVVIGQPNKTSNTTNNGGRDSDTLYNPTDALIYQGHLIISDSSNARVLIYNSIPTTDGASADVVLGQSDFSSGSYNYKLPDPIQLGITTKLTIVDGYLAVGSSTFNRILFFPLGPQNISLSSDSLYNTPFVELTLGADDAKDIMLSLESSFTNASWEAFSSPYIFDMTGNPDGFYTIYTKYRDFAEFEGETLSATFTLDTTPPDFDFEINDDGSITIISFDNLSSIVSVEFQIGGTDGEWTNCTALDGSFDEMLEEVICYIPGGASGKDIYYRIADSAGNIMIRNNILVETGDYIYTQIFYAISLIIFLFIVKSASQHIFRFDR